MTIYFVKAAEFVKIGFATNVRRRFAGIRAHNPLEVRLLATMPGDRGVEGSLHKKFREDWMHGEWFRLSESLRSFIDSLGAPSTDLIPQKLGKPRIWGFCDDVVVPSQCGIGDDMEQIIRENLIAIAKAYCKAEKVSLSTLSKRVYGNSTFFKDFAIGEKSIGIDKCDSVLEWFRGNWPENAKWPFVKTVFMNRNS